MRSLVLAAHSASFSHSILLLCALCVSAVSPAFAGPLDPPVGPIAPTAGPEPRTAINAANTPGDANSLFKITQPGSYYLAANITGVAARNGIEIAASNVTIDLSGFGLIGVPGSLDAIATEGNHAALVIRNGTINAWGSDGVDLTSAGTGDSPVVENIVAIANTGVGIRVFAGATIRNCAVRLNGVHGISTNVACLITGCLASGNGSNGVVTSAGSTLTHCAAWDNGANGFSVGAGCTISACNAYANSSNGVFAGTNCTIVDCTFASNGSDGLDASDAGTIRNCTSNSNSADGIEAGSGSLIADCVCRANVQNGIETFSNSIVRGNTCDSNGLGAGDGAGIRIGSNRSRVEGNNCAENDRGIDVDGSGNIIIRNTCSGNTSNWEIVVDNYYGPIINRTGIATAAASGAGAFASTLGSTDSNANISY